MFKERIMIVLRKIGFFALMFAIAMALIGIVYFVSGLVPQHSSVTETQWVIRLILGIYGLVFLLAVIAKVRRFIIWLFIEPFKNRKQEKEVD